MADSTRHAGPSNAETLAILTDIARIATEDLELRPLLLRITDALAARFGWDLVALVRIEKGSDRFVCEALTTELETSIYVGYSRALGSGVVGQVAATGEPIVIGDASEYPDFVDTLAGARSEICVPVKHLGQVVALLNVESLTPAAFSDQLPLLEAVARQIAGAISNARLYEELKDRTKSLEILHEVSRVALASGDLVDRLNGIAAYLRARFDLPLVSIVVSDDEGEEWVHQASIQRHPEMPIIRDRWPTAEGVIGRAIRTGEPQLVMDVHSDPDYLLVRDDVVAELDVPLKFHGRTLGAVNYEASSPDVFTPDTVELLETIANQLAGTIELAVVNTQLSVSQAELEHANKALLRLTRIDGLTGVANRRHFDETLTHEWRRTERHQRPFSLALFDIDHFKNYNDAYGHQRGDDALKQVAMALSAGLKRAGDLVARYGGEEFVAILPGLASEQAYRRVDELRRRIEALSIPHEHSAVAGVVVVTVSAGVATFHPDRAANAETLIAAADEALYAAKKGGRNCVHVASIDPGE